MQWLRLVAVVLGACGPGLAKPAKVEVPGFERPAARQGVPPPGDEAGFRALLQGDVTSGGLYFTDEVCRTQFGKPGTIAAEHYDEFASCVAKLHLRPTGRLHWIDDGSVVTDDAGFEIEAHVVDGKLDYIGFAGRAPGMPDLPTITPQTLESLRTGGDPKATISDDDAKRIMPPKATSMSQPLRVCLSPAGTIEKVLPGDATSPQALASFSALVRSWTFKPFVVGGRPVAACAIVDLIYPTGATFKNRLPAPPDRSANGNLVYAVSPLAIRDLQLTGDRLVVPDDVDKTRVAKMKEKRLVGAFKLCIDESGKYERGLLVKTTGLPGYDAKIARELMSWTYKPLLVDGQAVPFCSNIVFIYTQR